MSVAEIVETNPGHLGASNSPVERLGDEVRVVGRSIVSSKDEVVVLVALAELASVVVLNAAVLLEDSNCPGVEVDGSDTAGGFGSEDVISSQPR